MKNENSEKLDYYNEYGKQFEGFADVFLISLINLRISEGIYKETGNIKWTAISTLLPIAMGILLCLFIAQLWRLLM